MNRTGFSSFGYFPQKQDVKIYVSDKGKLLYKFPVSRYNIRVAGRLCFNSQLINLVN